MPTIHEINDAIASRVRVTATAADITRKGQPNRGVGIRVTRAFEETLDGRVRVTAEGYKGRFAVEDVRIANQDFATSPDTY